MSSMQWDVWRTDGRARLFWRLMRDSLTAADIYRNLQLVPRTAPLGKHFKTPSITPLVASQVCKGFCLAFLVINREQGRGGEATIRTGYVINHHSCSWVSDVTGDEAAETLLSGCVPQLQPDLSPAAYWMWVRGEGAVHKDNREDGRKTKKLAIKMGSKTNKTMTTCPTEPMAKILQWCGNKRRRNGKSKANVG